MPSRLAFLSRSISSGVSGRFSTDRQMISAVRRSGSSRPTPSSTGGWHDRVPHGGRGDRLHRLVIGQSGGGGYPWRSRRLETAVAQLQMTFDGQQFRLLRWLLQQLETDLRRYREHPVADCLGSE